MTSIQKFLQRIGLDPHMKVEHTIEFLNTIQYSCVTSISYENLDILAGKPLSLDYDSVFSKIVERKRGGYCFELNCLLAGILREMGFSVKDHFARCLRNEDSIPMRRHRMITVTLGKERFFLDIGVGNFAPKHPLLVTEGIIQEQFGEAYRFEKDDSLGWILWDYYKGNRRRFISFTEEEQYEIDFVQPSYYCEKHPDSIFNKVPMVAIKTPDGRKSIDNRDFKIFTGTELTYIEENVCDERFFELLKTHFNINCEDLHL